MAHVDSKSVTRRSSIQSATPEKKSLFKKYIYRSIRVSPGDVWKSIQTHPVIYMSV